MVEHLGRPGSYRRDRTDVVRRLVARQPSLIRCPERWVPAHALGDRLKYHACAVLEVTSLLVAPVPLSFRLNLSSVFRDERDLILTAVLDDDPTIERQVVDFHDRFLRFHRATRGHRGGS